MERREASLRTRLEGMYARTDVGSLKGIAWFTCRKAGQDERQEGRSDEV